MGEYARLNRMLEMKEETLANLRKAKNLTEEEMELMADIEQSIGEIKGSLLEMADIDGLDDPYKAFDY